MLHSELFPLGGCNKIFNVKLLCTLDYLTLNCKGLLNKAFGNEGHLINMFTAVLGFTDC